MSPLPSGRDDPALHAVMMIIIIIKMMSTWEVLCLRGPVARLWYGGGSSYLDGHVLVFPDIPDICAGTSTASLAENAPGLPGAGLLFLSNLLSGTNLQTASFRFRMVGHADCKTTNGHPQALLCFSFRGSIVSASSACPSSSPGTALACEKSTFGPRGKWKHRLLLPSSKSWMSGLRVIISSHPSKMAKQLG